MTTTRTSPSTIAKALNTLATWCQASGIKVLERNVTELAVEDAAGTEQRVTMATDGETGPYTVDIKRLTHRKLSIGLAAFAELQVALGFEAKSPINRGPILDRKLSNGEDSDLAAFRHTEFRRVPNPSDEKLGSYQWLINQASKEFFTSFQWLCQDHMLDIDDLKTHASIWTCNFIGLYERSELTQTENDKLLHSYLNQRFNEFRIILNNKARNELPSIDAAHIALHGRPYEHRDLGSHPHRGKEVMKGGGAVGCQGAWDVAPEREEEGDFGEDLDDDTKRAIAENAAVRAAVSAQELLERLAELGHDKMVEVLTEKMESNRIHPDAQRLAEKMLESHKEGCTSCSSPV